MMKNIRYIIFLFVFIFYQNTSFGQDAHKPNVIIIMPDNIGRDWLGAYGSHEQVTPHLDKLAQSGMLLENFWNMPSCAVSRTSLLAGRYPFRTGWTKHFVPPMEDAPTFDWNKELIFSRLLKEGGYKTSMAGKWQINDFMAEPEALTQHGFDEYYVWPGTENKAKMNSRYWNPYYILNGERRKMEGKFGPDVLNDWVLEFIEKNKDNPFLVYYPMNLCHSPFVETPENRNNESLNKDDLYKGMVKYMDHLIGKVMYKLDTLDIRENTMIIFLSDHSGPVAKLKGDVIWQGGTGPENDHRRANTPFIISWPKVIKPGQKKTQLVSVVDIFPTLADAANVRLPDSISFDGISILPFLKGDVNFTRPWIFSQMTRATAMRWIRDEQYLLYNDGRFFDLINDPHEEENLADMEKQEVLRAKQKLESILNGFPADAR